MRTLSAAIAATLIAAATPLANAATYHVKPTASGTGLGNDWNNACTLTFALTNADPGDSVWVAAGAPYKPANAGVSHALPNRVRVLGGFVGTETVETQRNPDPATNGCTLSGDLNGDDGPAAWQNYSDNCDHVVTASGLSSTDLDPPTELDGFTIRGGNGPFLPGGAGILISNCTGVRILRCRVTENQSEAEGGGIKMRDSSGTEIRFCEISNNRTLPLPPATAQALASRARTPPSTSSHRA